MKRSFVLQAISGKAFTSLTHIFRISCLGCATLPGSLAVADEIVLPAADPTYLEWQEEGSLPGYARGVVSGTVASTGTGGAVSITFDVEVGDTYTIYMEPFLSGGTPQVRMLNAAASVVASASGNVGQSARIQNYVAPAPGTYQVDFYFNNEVGQFKALVMRARDLQMEAEPNSTEGDATFLNFAGSGFSASHRWAGMLDSYDQSDLFDLGILGAGTNFLAGLELPAGSSLELDGPRLTLWLEGEPLPVAESQTGTLSHVIAEEGDYFLKIDTTGPENFLSMDGGGWVDLGNPSALQTVEDQTIEFWMKTDVLSGRRNPWAKAYGGEGTMTLEQDGTLNYFYGTGGGNTNPYQSFPTNFRLAAGTWAHYALVRDLTADTPTLYWYVNGELRNSAAASYPLAAASGLNAFIGQGYVSRMIGSMGEVRIWNKALSQNEVQSGMTQSVSGLSDTSGLAAGWDFSGSVESVLDDLSPNEADGTISGTASLGTAGHTNEMTASQQGWEADYLVSMTITDTSSLSVISTSLPEGGLATSELLSSFSVLFSKTLSGPTALDPDNFELVGSGLDDTFGTADDVTFTLVPSFDGRETVTLGIAEGPLTPGSYNFTVTTGLTDRLGNALDSTYSNAFSVETVGDYVSESYPNDTFSDASLAAPLSSDFAGSFVQIADNMTPGNNLWTVLAEDLDDDGVADLIAVRSNGQMVLYQGLGGGTYGEPVVISIASEAFSCVVGDIFKNGRQDIAISCRNANRVQVFRNTGDADFSLLYELAVDQSVSSRPVQIGMADFDGDGWLDLAVPHDNSDILTILFNDTLGGFGASTFNTGGGNGLGLAVGDLDGDGAVDVVLSHPSSRDVQIMRNDGSGSFSADGTYAASTSNRNPDFMDLADLDDDGELDIVLSYNYNDGIDVFRGDGSGGFEPVQKVAFTGYRYSYRVRAVKEGPGQPAYVLAGGNNGPTVYRFEPTGGGLSYTSVHYTEFGEVYGLDMEDLDGDGLLDLAMGVYNGTVRIALGQLANPLPDESALGSRLQYAHLRGLIESDEVDYFRFSIDSPKRLILAMHTLIPSVYYSRARVRLYGPNQAEIGNFVSGVSGNISQGNYYLGSPGVYYLRIERYDSGFSGEYRMRVSLMDPSDQLESESNDNTGSADSLSFSPLAPELPLQSQEARVWGYHDPSDNNGDFYRLPNLGVGTEIDLLLELPAHSPLNPLLRIYDGSGSLVLDGALGVLTQSFTIGDPANAPYYVRVESESASRGLLSEYTLKVALTDNAAPSITATSLPAGTTTSLPNVFSLTFSEDMLASTVNDLANYEMRGMGPDATFDTADDTIYTVATWSSYDSGFTTELSLPDGPMPPDTYRFTASSAISDRFGNGLAVDFTTGFTLEAPADPFILESEPDNGPASAILLGTDSGTWGGSYSLDGDIIATADRPWQMVTLDLNDDTFEDMVVASTSGNIQFYLNDGAGGFSDPLTYGIGGSPAYLVSGDWNADNLPDIAVSVYNIGQVRIFLNTGDDSGGPTTLFSEAIIVSTGNQPYQMVTGNFNGDAHQDILVANYTGNMVHLLAGDSTGSFTQTDTALPNRAIGIASEDFTGNGHPDFAVSLYSQRELHVYENDGTGTFTPVQQLPASTSNRNLYYLASGDINNDGIPDIVMAYDYNQVFDYYLGLDDGTLDAVRSVSTGSWNYQYNVNLIDPDGDTVPDLVLSRNDGLQVFSNTFDADQPFASGLHYNIGATYDIGMLDLNNDGLQDIIVPRHDADQVYLLSAQNGLNMPVDNGEIALKMGMGRGYVANSSDNDYFSFYAESGDRIQVMAYSESSVYYSRVRLYINGPNEQQITNFVTNVAGNPNLTQFVAPYSGRYTIQVNQYDQYYGEYRFRVSIVSEAVQLESENNDSINNGDDASFADEEGDSVARFFGALPGNDNNGDYFKLGNLGIGTTLTLEVRLPEAGSAVPVLEVYGPSNSLVASAAAGEKTLVYQVPAEGAGNHTARIRPDSGTADFFSQYLITITLADTTPPTITADTLPAEDSQIQTIFDRFSISFSEDMVAATVNDTANYELVSSGPDGTFDTGDDEAYSIAMLSTYASGLSARYWITDGPMQPGAYRFRVATSLQDLAGNTLENVYQRSWEVLPVEGILLEGRDNDTFESPEILSSSPEAAFDGSFGRSGTVITGLDGPWDLETADFNLDGYPDLAVILFYGAQLLVYPGQSDGSLGDPVAWATGNNPYDIVTGDFNKDGRPDLAVSHWDNNNLSVYLNIDDPAIFSVQDYPIGNRQRQAAIGDLNGDGHEDIIVARETTVELQILYGDGAGNFAATTLTTSGHPCGVVADDFDGDGLDDLVVGSRYSPSTLTRYVNLGDGVFEIVDTYNHDRNPFFLTSGDLDGDGMQDLVLTFEYRDGLFIYPGSAGSWDSPVFVSHGRWNYPYKTRIQDVDMDGTADLIVGGSGSQGMGVHYNSSTPGNFSFSSPEYHPVQDNAYSGLVMEWPGGELLFAIAAYDFDQIHLLPPNGTKGLDPDPVNPLVSGFIARGNLSSSSDEDFWTFSATAGSRLIVTSVSINPDYYSRKRFRLYNSQGYELTNWVNSVAGNQHETDGIYLPYAGTYYLRVQNYDNNSNEYRFQMNLLQPGVATESENNNSINNADIIPFGHNGSPSEARMGGVLIREDSSGDYFNASNLGESSSLVVTPQEISSSALQPHIQILDSGGGLLAESFGDVASWTAPEGFGGAVYVRILDETDNRDLDSIYIVDMEVVDNQPPVVVSDTLPDETTTALVSSFTLNFNEEMMPASVQDGANYELRRAAVPGIWGPEDEILTLTPPAYSSGLSASFSITEVPLVPGSYRLLVDTGLTDRWGNSMASPYVHEFTVGKIDGHTTEIWPSDTAENATPVELDNSQPNFFSGGGRSFLLNNSQTDYWSFNASVGDQLVVEGRNDVYSSYYSRLRWRLYAPDGTELFNYISGVNGAFDPQKVLLDQEGTHLLTVSPYDGYYSEYRFRIYLASDPVQMESEPNDDIASGNTLALSAIDEDAVGATASGYVRQNSDFDYFDLGTVDPGYSIFLSVRTPQDSPLTPVVAVYRADNTFMQEAAGGKTGDSVAEVRITDSAQYYALVRASGPTGGTLSGYLLDVQVAPTALVSFPNLLPGTVSATLPDPVRSGDSFDYAISISNSGSQDLATGGWTDRVVLSTNTTIGDSDDVLVANHVRVGGLASGASYLLNGTGMIPDGFAGDLYLGVLVDTFNVVNEFLFEGDNAGITEESFTVELRPYPDLVVEDLTATDVPESTDWSISWNVVNRGTASTAVPHSQRLLVTNLSTNEVVLNTLIPVDSVLDVDGSAPFNQVISVTDGGTYRVRVIADAFNEVYEYNGLGHLAAEQNIFDTSFIIASFFSVNVQAQPEEGGSVSGSGVYAEGTPVTVTATPDTSVQPYFFSRWSEGGGFVSANESYEFNIGRDRNLVAEFLLPTYPVTASVLPAGAGSISGTGSFAHGSDALLTATSGPGYLFSAWTEGGSTVTTNNPYGFTVTSARSLVAVFEEANPEHDVTVVTSPAGIASIPGAGTYENGINLVLNAPANVIDGDTEYIFERFLLNGAVTSLQPDLEILLTTAYPATMDFVAEYSSRSLKPVVSSASGSKTSPVPMSVDYQVTITFDRPMDTGINPAGSLLSDDAATTATLPAGGTWLNSTSFRFPAVNFGPDNGGTYRLQVSGGTDQEARVMDPAEVFTFVVDTDPPEAVTPVLADYSESSATLAWVDYPAPADLLSFRVFLSTSPFSSTTGMTPVAAPAGAARQVVLQGLSLDTEYHAAVVAVDSAGNGISDVTPITFTMDSDVPDPVNLVVVASAPGEATLDWTTYPENTYRGLSGYRVYMDSSQFSSVEGMTPIDELSKGERQLVVEGLDRTVIYWFAVVAFNRQDESNSNVVSQSWEDPLSGEISENMALGPGIIDILNPVSVTSGADLTLLPGTTLRFATDAGLTIEDGRLLAEGTAFEPILLTSINDDPETGPPAPGDWGKLEFADPFNVSILDNVAIRFGQGLVFSGQSPSLGLVAVLNHLDAGILVGSASQLTGGPLLVQGNGTGIRIVDGGTATLNGSVIKNNTVQVHLDPTVSNDFSGNWWGSSDPATISAGWIGPVDGSSPLAGEPVLNTAIDTVSGESLTGSQTVDLLVSSLNAESYRMSEDSAFPGVLFSDLPVDEWTGSLFRQGGVQVPFTLSAGAGMKTVFVQFRSLTGELSSPVSLDVEYVTEGPVVNSFNLTEGMEIVRPINVSASASAVLGMKTIKFLVDNVETLASGGGTLNGTWDIRSMAPGLHRVQIVATDFANNVATRAVNVYVTPRPPAQPVITSPANKALFNSTPISVSGTAEPGISIRLSRNGTNLANMTVGANGNFTFPTVGLVEGLNRLVVTAFDSLGNTPSQVVEVSLDTVAPAALILDPTTFDPVKGLQLFWRYPETGKRASRFRVLWHTAPFSSVGEASGQSASLDVMQYFLKGLTDGTYWIGVVGYDAAGNVSGISNLYEYAYDNSAPVLTVSYDKSQPVGPGDLVITLTSNEPLVGTPTLSVQPAGMPSPISVPMIADSPQSFSGTYPVSDLSARTGKARVRASARDIRGNLFNGTPAGPDLVFDVTRPTGQVTVSEDPPIQTDSQVTLDVGLTLSKPPAPGSEPFLEFSPPLGDVIEVELTGAAEFWSGTLTLGPSQGDGFGSFLMEVTDSAGNTGTTITSGMDLELYTSEFPTPPGRPVGLEATTLPGGEIRIEWEPVSLAETYAIYREEGNAENPPQALLIDAITGTTFTDLPPNDGIWSYVVTAVRRGSEGLPSGILPALSDRTPPGTPTNVLAELLNQGVAVSWNAPEGEVPARYKVYRNDAVIRQVQTATGITDAPPRGLMTYTVASVDPYGNEAVSDGSALELYVDAVSNLTATLSPGTGPSLTWSINDPGAVGFYINRDGVRLNTSPVTQSSYTDSQPPQGASVEYSVRAVNAEDQESAPRSVVVHPFTMNLVVNPDESGTASDPVIHYFDTYSVELLNEAGNQALPINELRAERTQSGVPAVSQSWPVNWDIASGGSGETDLVLPATTVRNSGQTLRLRAVNGPDAGGSTVIYQNTASITEAYIPDGMVTLSVAQAPLAGGLTDFSVTLHNRGYATMDVVFSRKSGSEAGDIYLSILDENDLEVNRHYSVGLVPGLIFRPNGDGLLRVEPGQSVTVPMKEVLVPEALGESGFAKFVVVAEVLYHDTGLATQQVAGPITGDTSSDLTQTPYYGTSMTAQQVFADDEDVILTGQALDRDTAEPVPNVPLKIGIASGGFRWFDEVTTDENGDYSFTYKPPVGFSGVLDMWACHPDIFDSLDQTHISYYRMYITPSLADIVMSRSDTLDFTLQVINPGDVELSGFSLDSQAYTIVDEEEVETDLVTVDFNGPAPARLKARQKLNFKFRLQADIDAPDDPIVEFTLHTAEGASATFRGRISLRPAVPVLSVTSPTNGYVDVSVNRGELVSREVTVKNLGLRPLEGVELVPPAGLEWFDVNLARDSEGKILWPDIPVGGSRVFTVVFTPPDDTELGYYDDFLLIKGSNAVSDFRLNLFAKVTSNLTGGVDFYVDNVYVDPVPNASIRLRNSVLRQEVGPILTDASGHALIEDLQEGEWSWQVIAPGHSASTGTVEVIPDQVVDEKTRLQRSLVTVNFSVVPKPFTDRYEIVIEQTFETHVPVPVMVWTPPYLEFTNPEPGFETIIITEMRNEGLVSYFDVEIKGRNEEWGSLTPLITYIPEVRAQEVIEVPMRIKFNGRQTSSGGNLVGEDTASPAGVIGDCVGSLLPNSLNPDVLLGLAALANAAAQCSDGVGFPIAASMLVGLDLFNSISTLANPFAVAASLIGCFVGKLISAGLGGGGGGGGVGPGGGTGYGFYGDGCFPEYALVEMVDGSELPISQVEAGMWVSTGDSEIEKALVTERVTLISDHMISFELESISHPGKTRTFDVTDEHRIWTHATGWEAACNLKPGDILVGQEGERFRISSVQRKEGDFHVYTLELDNANALFVDGILVQDLCGGMHLGPEDWKTSEVSPQP